MEVRITLKSTVINRAHIRFDQIVAGGTLWNNETNHTKAVGCAIATAIEESGSRRKHTLPASNRHRFRSSVPINRRLLRCYQLPILEWIQTPDAECRKGTVKTRLGSIAPSAARIVGR